MSATRFGLSQPAERGPVAVCAALVLGLSVLVSIGCGGDAQADITKDTSCRDYINAPSDVRHDAAIRISIDVGASSPGNPMWALTADAACGSNPDATVGAAVGGGRSSAETTTQAQPTEPEGVVSGFGALDPESCGADTGTSC